MGMLLRLYILLISCVGLFAQEPKLEELIHLGDFTSLLPTQEEYRFVEENRKQETSSVVPLWYSGVSKLNKKEQELLFNIDYLGLSPKEETVKAYAEKVKRFLGEKRYSEGPLVWLTLLRFKTLQEIRAAMKGSEILRLKANLLVAQLRKFKGDPKHKKEIKELTLKAIACIGRAARLGDGQAMDFFGLVYEYGMLGVKAQEERRKLYYFCGADQSLHRIRNLFLRELEKKDPAAYALEPNTQVSLRPTAVKKAHFQKEKELQNQALSELMAPAERVNPMVGFGKDDYNLSDKENDDEGLEVKEPEETPLLRKADAVRPAEIYLVENGEDKGATPSRSTSVVRHRLKR